MRVLLFFPPQCRPLHPHLALPLIKTELQSRGHECKVVDLNIRFYQHVLTPSTLQQAEERIEALVARMDSMPSLQGSDAVRFARMSAALVRAPYLIEHVESAVHVLHSEEIYDYGKFLWSRKVIEESLELYSSAFGHADIGFSHLRMRYSTSNPEEIWTATSDPAENPFLEMLPQWADEEISSFRPDVIGMTFALDEQLIPGFTLARHLRENWKGLMVAGGTMVTRLRKELPVHPLFKGVFDHYLPWESECQFGDLVDSLAARSAAAPPPPAEQQAPASLAKSSGGKRQVPHFTTLCPDFSDLPLDSYLLPVRVLPFMSSRGCSYGRCVYCSHYKTYDRFVLGDPEVAAAQLQELSVRYGCKYFYFVDEAIEPKFGLSLVKELEKRSADIRWMVFGRFHQGWTSEVVNTLARGGCRRLIFGIDAATDRIQALMHKNTDLQHAEHILQSCASAGIAVQLNFITGFPGETEPESRAALEFLTRNHAWMSTLGSNAAFASFALVRDAPWDQMAITPIPDPAKSFAMYYAFRATAGLQMDAAYSMAQWLQTSADEVLGSSRRGPLIREFAFLYRDRFKDTLPQKTERAPEPSPIPTLLSHDLRKLFVSISKAMKALPVSVEEHVSTWWRLSTESNDIASAAAGDLFSFSVATRFTSNTFELPIVDAFVSQGNILAVPLEAKSVAAM